jgi:hypothetical protein
MLYTEPDKALLIEPLSRLDARRPGVQRRIIVHLVSALVQGGVRVMLFATIMR